MTQPRLEGRPHAPPRGRAWAVVAGATLAGALAGALAAASLPSRSPAPAACACDPDPDGRIHGELSVLRGEVESLQLAVALAAARDGRPRAPERAAADARPLASGAAPRADVRPAPAVRSAPPAAAATGAQVVAYERFDVPTGAVTVEQGSSGEIVARNTDPALEGSEIEVTAYSADAPPERLRIVVPPAEVR